MSSSFQSHLIKLKTLGPCFLVPGFFLRIWQVHKGASFLKALNTKLCPPMSLCLELPKAQQIPEENRRSCSLECTSLFSMVWPLKSVVPQ